MYEFKTITLDLSELTIHTLDLIYRKLLKIEDVSLHKPIITVIVDNVFTRNLHLFIQQYTHTANIIIRKNTELLVILIDHPDLMIFNDPETYLFEDNLALFTMLK